MIDSSPMYGSAESVVGDVVAELGVRPRVFVATKVGPSGKEAGIAQMRRSAERKPGPRPDPNPQPARLARASRDVARHENQGAGALYRHHALYDGVAARIGAHSRQRAGH